MDRRSFLSVGGAAVIGLALPPGLHPPAPVRRVRMWSDATGAAVGFDPIGLAVDPGTVVRWILESGVHSTTAYHADLHGRPTRIPAGARPWDSGLRSEPGVALETTLEAPGVYDVYCLPHEAAGMVARIVVGRPGEDFEVPAWASAAATPAAAGIPPAALAGFPAVERIARRGVVRHPAKTPTQGDDR